MKVVGEDISKGETPLANAPCFIEHQFPVAKISMESYKERMAGTSQTLTSLGKWWGRKPLILVRAALFGLLIPASNDPEKDREIFVKLMTMDREGLWHRKKKTISLNRLAEEFLRMPPSLQQRFFEPGTLNNTPKLRELGREEKKELQSLVFERLPYAEKLEYCLRPEQIDGPAKEEWQEINTYLGTHATSLADLACELGKHRFGHRPRVGDAFCGGGSVPFEAARLGCDAYGSDLNPVAALLTWASLHLLGGNEEIARGVEKKQKEVYQVVEKQIKEWGIEYNSLGWRADAYLYCVEVTDPESGWKIPLLPTLAIAPKTRVIAHLVPDNNHKCFDICILENVSEAEYSIAAMEYTVKDSRLFPPHGGPSTPIDVIRRDLRLWENSDIAPRPDDVFQERLYCIRWFETSTDTNGKKQTRRHYRSPNTEDLRREARVVELLQDFFADWQQKGYIPNWKIEPGEKTDEPIRTRGWTYWHHLFMPRQLLMGGLFSKLIYEIDHPALNILLLGKITNHNSKLSRWKPLDGGGIGGVMDVFTNQALNTMCNYGCRPSITHKSLLLENIKSKTIGTEVLVQTCDARNVQTECDIWITDPPYADAIKYDEISEFFLAWYEKHLNKLFPNWYSDSKRALAVKGNDEGFRNSMVDCYKQLTKRMPDEGMQIVMFTHQDAAVWADLTMILWASGLRVTAAWTIATETDTALKQGNYVQGTVLLVLRKRIETEPVFLDEISHKVEAEVRHQLDTMIAIEDDSDPNFGDADYQLAAYAAALRVLTERPIYEIDPEKEILRQRLPSEVGPVEQLIRRAVKIACDHLVPRGLDSDLWKQLGPMERFYLKGLEVESHGEYRSGVYQELARGFGATDYTVLLSSAKANETRLKDASEFGKRMISGEGFAGSLVRQCLFAIYLTVKDEDTQEGINWLRTELADYWGSRVKVIHILEYLSRLRFAAPMVHWEKDAHAAGLLAGAVRNDHV